MGGDGFGGDAVPSGGASAPFGGDPPPSRAAAACSIANDGNNDGNAYPFSAAEGELPGVTRSRV